MLKRILAPLDSSEFSKAATRMAAHIALRDGEDGATLAGLSIVDLDQIPHGRFANIVPRDQIIADAEKEADELIRSFQKEVQDMGVPPEKVETVKASGSPFREIIRESVFSDMIVMGEKCSFPPVNQDYETLSHLYHEASRPVLITERDFNSVDTVVMVMDGTAPSSRMMYNFVHLNPFPSSQVVLTYSEEEEKEYNLKNFFQRVEAFLSSYGLSVRTKSFPGAVESEISGIVGHEKAQVLALAVHRQHFLEKLSDPLLLRENFATRLLHSVSASLFVVH